MFPAVAGGCVRGRRSPWSVMRSTFITSPASQPRPQPDSADPELQRSLAAYRAGDFASPETWNNQDDNTGNPIIDGRRALPGWALAAPVDPAASHPLPAPHAGLRVTQA